MDIAQEQFDIARSIERYHSLFYHMWDTGVMVEDESISTAAVEFTHDGKALRFLINPKWWGGLDQYTKEFVICHECLHIALKHGKRVKHGVTEAHNRAMDVVVNHMLVDEFGFDRKKIDISEDLCWIDTVFSKKSEVKIGDCFEYYYSLLKNEKNWSGNGNVLDNHEAMNRGGSSDEDIDGYMDSIGENLPDDIKKDLQEKLGKEGEKSNNKRRGHGGGGWLSVQEEKKKSSKKWETVIKDWSKAHLKYTDATEYQWTHINRRFVNLPNDFILPTEHNFEVANPDKIVVYFFIDTSGSCIGYKQRFYKAAHTLPEDRFDVRTFSFDTQVREFGFKGERNRFRSIYGGGGTDFQNIERFIQDDCRKEKIDYPASIFVLTDGWGGNVTVEHPERWYWFLTSRSRSVDGYLPIQSHKFDLKKYA